MTLQMCPKSKLPDQPSQTALFDATHLTLSNCLVRLRSVVRGKNWRASMRGKDREHLIRVADTGYEPRISWTRSRTQLAFQSMSSTCDLGVHGYFRSLGNTRFNFFVPIGAPPTKPGSARVKSPGLYLLRDDVHPVLSGLVFSSRHPYVSEPTATDGQYALSDVPPGTYEIELVHEGIGIRKSVFAKEQYDFDPPIILSRQVEVRPGKTTTVDWTVDTSNWADGPHIVARGPLQPHLDAAFGDVPQAAAAGRAKLVRQINAWRPDFVLSRNFSQSESKLLALLRREARTSVGRRSACVTTKGAMLLDDMGVCWRWVPSGAVNASGAQVSLSRHGTVAMGGTTSEGAALFVLQPNTELVRLKGDYVTELAWNPQGTVLAATTEDASDVSRLFLLRSVKGQLSKPVQVQGALAGIGWSPDGTCIATSRLGKSTTVEEAGASFRTLRAGELVIVDVDTTTVTATGLVSEDVGTAAWTKAMIALPAAGRVTLVAHPYMRVAVLDTPGISELACVWASKGEVLFVSGVQMDPSADDDGQRGTVVAFDRDGKRLGSASMPRRTDALCGGGGMNVAFFVSEKRLYRVTLGGTDQLGIEPLARYPLDVLGLDAAEVQLPDN